MRIPRVQPFARHLTPRSLVAVCLLVLCGSAPARQAEPTRRAPAAEDEIVLRGPVDSDVEAIAVSPDGSCVATLDSGLDKDGLPEASVRLWDMTTQRVRFSATLGEISLPTCGEGWHALRAHVNSLWQITFSPDGRFLAAGAWGVHTVKVWEVATGKKCLNLALDDASRRNRIEWHRRSWFSPDGRTLTIHLDRAEWTGDVGEEVETRDTDLVFVDTATWRVRSRRAIATEDVYASALWPDGTAFIVASCGGPVITTWDLAASPPRVAARLEIDPPNAPEERGPEDLPKFAPDGSAVVESRGRIFRWSDGRPRIVRLEGSRDLSALEFSSDGRLVGGIRNYGRWRIADKVPEAVGDWLRVFMDIDECRAIGEAIVWDAATGRRLGSRIRLDRCPQAIAAFRDGRRVAISDGKDVILWRLSLR